MEHTKPLSEDTQEDDVTGVIEDFDNIHCIRCGIMYGMDELERHGGLFFCSSCLEYRNTHQETCHMCGKHQQHHDTEEKTESS